MSALWDNQREYTQRLRDRLAGGTYHIVTYGCQMNARESETLAGMLAQMGLAATDARNEADVLLFNTCCIRENAEKRLFGNIGRLREVKRERPHMRIGVLGCMMQQQGVAERFLKRYPFVDFVIGTQGMHRLPQVLHSSLEGRQNAVIEDERIVEGLPVRRGSPFYASIAIMYGCENHCSYCVVPSVRGKERSRDYANIVNEAETLAKDGVKEIMLLGQNVNSFSGGISFPELLRKLNGIVPRIRFMTSHPKDCTPELIAAMAECDSVCKQLHLPVQSGSDDILKRMDRKYTVEHYLSLVDMARRTMPDIGLTTDMIVGFPGETEEDFEKTLSLMETVRFDAAYMFAFSPRKGTPAERMDGQHKQDVKDERLARLIARKERITDEVLASLIGSADTVLIEGNAKRGNGVTGRTGRGVTMNISAPASPGEIRSVRYTQALRNTAKGEFV